MNEYEALTKLKEVIESASSDGRVLRSCLQAVVDHIKAGSWEGAEEALGKVMTYGHKAALKLDEAQSAAYKLKWIIEKTAGLDEDDHRICSECGRIMRSGYIVDDCEYFCSDACLHKNYSQEEYLEMYENDAAYWTEWGE